MNAPINKKSLKSGLIVNWVLSKKNLNEKANYLIFSYFTH